MLAHAVRSYICHPPPCPCAQERKRKPDWMKRNTLPGGEKYTQIKSKLRELKLHTVCEEAK